MHREEHLHAGAFAERENAVGDFVHRVLLHFLAAVQAVGAAHARVQQAQVVVDLGGGGDGRARIAGRVLLPDGDGRRDAVDDVHVGLFDALQELARIGRQRLDVAALPLGVDGVERERRLARTRDPRHHRQGVVRNLEVDVLQVVDACSAYDDALVRHGPGNRRQPGATQPMRQAYRLLQQELPKLLIIAVCRRGCRSATEQPANAGQERGQQSDCTRNRQKMDCVEKENANRKEQTHNCPRLVTSQRW